MNRLFAFAALAFLVAFTSCGLLENDDISDPIKDYGDFELQENVIFTITHSSHMLKPMASTFFHPFDFVAYNLLFA